MRYVGGATDMGLRLGRCLLRDGPLEKWWRGDGEKTETKLMQWRVTAVKETSCKAEAKKNIPAEENKTKEINSSMRFPLFYSPKPRSQGRSLIYWNWAFGVLLHMKTSRKMFGNTRILFCELWSVRNFSDDLRKTYYSSALQLILG